MFHQLPQYEPYLFAIPNGGLRNKAVAGKLKAEGVKAGVPDLFLAVPRGDYHGLFVEMKRREGGKLSKDQKEMIELLRGMGYAAEVARGADEALETVRKYLEVE